MAAHPTRPRRLLLSLALQNLGRRKTRTALLLVAVAISSAIVFTGAVLMRSIGTSTAVGFSRLGADLMVVPEGTLANITAALLTVEPTDLAIDADMLDAAPPAGISRIAPQRIFRTDQSGSAVNREASAQGAGQHDMSQHDMAQHDMAQHDMAQHDMAQQGTGSQGKGNGESVDLIGFDPDRDFTVIPWITDRLGRPMQPGDVILGAARDMPLGAEMVLFGEPFRVWARLGRTGVGTHERGIFMPSSSLLALAPAIRARTGAAPPMLEPGKVSGFLVELAPGATELQIRFALLSRLSGVKVVVGDSLLTGVRQGLTSLFGGTFALIATMFASTAIMVSVLFSAIVAERRRELGLLKAIGARRAQIVGMMLIEAVVATAAGSAIGVAIGALLLRVFERSLVYSLNEIGIPFLWLDNTTTILIAFGCIVAAAMMGGIGALTPAWRASRHDAYDLIRGEG